MVTLFSRSPMSTTSRGSHGGRSTSASGTCPSMPLQARKSASSRAKVRGKGRFLGVQESPQPPKREGLFRPRSSYFMELFLMWYLAGLGLMGTGSMRLCRRPAFRIVAASARGQCSALSCPDYAVSQTFGLNFVVIITRCRIRPVKRFTIGAQRWRPGSFPTDSTSGVPAGAQFSQLVSLLQRISSTPRL